MSTVEMTMSTKIPSFFNFVDNVVAAAAAAAAVAVTSPNSVIRPS
jgi:hypothetical protein